MNYTLNKKVLVIDNYDSFTFNLVHYIESLDFDVRVVRNDQLSNLELKNIQKIILSPGPGLPSEAGELNSFIKQYAVSKSILGICLGQQAIAELFGGTLEPLHEVKHGVSCQISHFHNDEIYEDIPEIFDVGLYYSWHTTLLPKNIIPTATNNNGIIMSIKHENYNLRAVQFHPESIMTPYGKKILENWLKKT